MAWAATGTDPGLSPLLVLNELQRHTRYQPQDLAESTTTSWDPTWSRFAGLYRGRGDESQVIELNKRLVVITPDAPNLDTPVRLEPIGNGQFRYTAPTGGGPVGEVVRFVEENGRVVRMYTGDGYVERVQ